MTTKRFLQLANKLDEALDESVNIFLDQRPFLEDKTLQAEILSQSERDTERKVDNEILIEEVVHAICS